MSKTQFHLVAPMKYINLLFNKQFYFLVVWFSYFII